MAEAIVINQQAPLMSVLRQAGVLIGIAASVALGVYVVMWARTPTYSILYADLSDRDLSQIVDALDASDIVHRMEPGSGAILVPSGQVHNARLKLATAGLPKGAGMGFEMLDEQQGFGTSQFIERARYQHAVEGELSRSITRIDNVRAARVHLAIPKQSAFARAKRDPSASVIVDLYNGRRLEAHQVAAIARLVSASVPNLSIDAVAVVDQQGNLLTDGAGGAGDLALTAKRFEYTHRLEESYIARVEAILMPLVGPDGVRAQVTADIDFTSTEHTRESFDPDLPAIRSESLLEEERSGGGAGGVPGALSNEPPVAAQAPEEVAVAEQSIEGGGIAPAPTTAPQNRRNQTTRNYELDRTISHTKPAVGGIRRLSVAVVVRNPSVAAPDGDGAAPAVTGFPQTEIERMTNLVKEAIGFDAARGDSVSLTSADFLKPQTPEPLPQPPIWKEAWVWDVAKQVLGGLFVLFVMFGVIRPTVKSLMAKPTNGAALAPGQQAALPDGSGHAAGADGTPALEQDKGGQRMLLPGAMPDADQIKRFVGQEPKMAAQVVRSWVGDRG